MHHSKHRLLRDDGRQSLDNEQAFPIWIVYHNDSQFSDGVGFYDSCLQKYGVAFYWRSWRGQPATSKPFRLSESESGVCVYYK